jgi:type II secretory pathway pseudopilin PulG
MKPALDRQAGYTIIETMIFLIISGALLLSALALFNGRLQRTQFTQAVQAFDAQIKSTANEAATGTYPDFPFDCDLNGQDPNPRAGNGTQGQRSGCIFVGKVMAPSAQCSGDITQTVCSKVDVYSVVGRRLLPDDHVVSSLTGINGAKPTVITDPDTITQTIKLDYDTRITSVSQPTAFVNFPLTASGVGFFQSFNGSYNNTGNLNSGAQNIQTWVVRASSPPYAPLSADDMKATVHAEAMNQPSTSNSIYFCLKSSSGDQYASIRLVTVNSTLATNVEIGGALCRNGI